MTAAVLDWSGVGLAHEAFFYRSEQEVLARCLPFVAEALGRDEPVLLLATEEVRTALLTALGADGSRLALVAAAEEWFSGGHECISAHDAKVREQLAVGRPWRLVAEPMWIADEVGRQWARFESAANEFYAAVPYYSLCLHDARRLPADVLAEARRTHPLVWDGKAPVPSRDYVAPEEFIASVERPLSPAPAAAVRREIRGYADVGDARSWLAGVCRALGAGWRATEVRLAVHELVTNAVRAAGAARLTVWTEAGALVCEVTDSGPGFRVGVAGYAPPEPRLTNGRGLWLARSLADDATVRSGPEGTTARLWFGVE